MTEQTAADQGEGPDLLGLSTSELAGLTVDELLENKTAITMLLHYYSQLVDENNAFKNEVNTLRTYVDGYERKKSFASIGSILLVLSSILTGFGVGLITAQEIWPGIATFIPGLALAIAGLYFSNRD